MNTVSSPSFPERPPDMDDSIPISALQHFLYCPRQCALIHIEQTFEENLYTLRGNRVHERAHEAGGGVADGVRLERALPLYSETLGLIGQADVVEFRGGVPYPVEYKAGARKKRDADDAQLCAQAMCLEEMLGVNIPEGSLYYDRSKRRRVVMFTEELRQTVRDTARAVRALYDRDTLPEPAADERCRACSLLDACMPFELRELRVGSISELRAGSISERRAVDPFAVQDAP